VTRALILVALTGALLISAWAGVRHISLLRSAPTNAVSGRAYCDTGRGVFLPCVFVEPDSAKV
jgi:hypothetical protein